jgi:flagellar motor switch protein FliN/FliY
MTDNLSKPLDDAASAVQPAVQSDAPDITSPSVKPLDATPAADDSWTDALAEQAAADQAAGPQPRTQGSQTAEASSPAADPAGSAIAGGFFKSLSGNNDGSTADIDMIMDVPVQLTVELGRTRLPIKSLLQLGQGSVVELDGLAGEPMDIFVNGYLIAQGEVVVIDEKYGIRLTDIITPSERLNRLNNRR